jgi:hypothetical protein
MRRLADLVISGSRPPEAPESGDWVHDELAFVREAAQAEAGHAYDVWCSTPSAEAYARYRAAQDRADAAQDELALWVTTMARIDADPAL